MLIGIMLPFIERCSRLPSVRQGPCSPSQTHLSSIDASTVSVDMARSGGVLHFGRLYSLHAMFTLTSGYG